MIILQLYIPENKYVNNMLNANEVMWFHATAILHLSNMRTN